MPTTVGRVSMAHARSVDEVKDIRDKAIAMAAYARQAKNHDLEADAVEIRQRAECRLGEMLTAAKESGQISEGRRKQTVNEEVQFPRVTLTDVGIDRNLSSRAQKLAAMPKARFEQLVSDTREAVTRAVQTVRRGADIEIEKQGYSDEIQDGCTVDDLGSLAAAGKKFSVIYADPPWSFNVYSGKGKQRSADRQYDTMSLDDIKALPVEQLAADDCALFLWATVPMLPDALRVMTAWGFDSPWLVLEA